MSFSFNSVLPAPKYKVRVLIADTDENSPLVSDEFIEFALEENGDNIYKAAAECCRAISAKFARKANTTVENVSVNFTESARAYMEMAVRFEKEGRTRNIVNCSPVVTGISESAIAAQRADSDRVQEKFSHNQFEDPEGNPSNVVRNDPS